MCVKGVKSRQPLRTMYVGSVPESHRLPLQLQYQPTPWKQEAKGRVVRLNKHKYVLPKLSENYCNFKMGSVVLEAFLGRVKIRVSSMKT